ncbi:hypothetical protein RND71_019322 [Anisodus tanguticus]|uniref:Uncharacterized protein n=1 Tax=Anisodus tanguticus TaxID=243964 RepID=A0AAE1VHB1_9SOLA|nr:hypothetical protein RND71_019322 [Anisodus tanguticus]
MDESWGSGCVGADKQNEHNVELVEHIATISQDETELMVVNDPPRKQTTEEIVTSNEKAEVEDDNVHEKGLDDNKGEKDKSENVLQNLKNIYNQGGVSPRSISKGQKKSGRLANGEKQPIRARQVQHYKRVMGMQSANSSCNGKIWYFVAENIDHGYDIIAPGESLR